MEVPASSEFEVSNLLPTAMPSYHPRDSQVVLVEEELQSRALPVLEKSVQH